MANSKQAARGSRSGAAQRRYNAKMSDCRLRQLLAANFAKGARLITLQYTRGKYVPCKSVAQRDIGDWIKKARHAAGGQLPYIRSMEYAEENGRQVVHRVVLDLSVPCLPEMVKLWTFGPAAVEPISAQEVEALATLLTAPIRRGSSPRARAWAASRGLIRERAGTKFD